MKTASDVIQELDSLVRSINRDSSEKEIKSAQGRAVFLRMCLRYLETSPRECYIQSELGNIKRRIELLPTHFSGWQTGKVLTRYKDPYASYCSEMGLSDMKAQVKTLEYLLS